MGEGGKLCSLKVPFMSIYCWEEAKKALTVGVIQLCHKNCVMLQGNEWIWTLSHGPQLPAKAEVASSDVGPSSEYEAGKICCHANITLVINGTTV